MELTALPTLGTLIAAPAVVALLLLIVRSEKPRTFITVIGALVIACASIFAAISFITQCSQGTYAVRWGRSSRMS